MARTPQLMARLRGLLEGRPAESLSDADLLERFARERDRQAFGILVRRHGPLVLDVCRRHLGNFHDAEDAFQATFLVLARKAGSIRQAGSLASWLYGVAFRVARKARSAAARRRHHEEEVRTMSSSRAEPQPFNEVGLAIDEEIVRLPEKFRAPLVLCCLEGKTGDEAARELGYSAGSMSWRLARARDLLRDRLIRRGVTLAPAALASILSERRVGAGLAEPVIAEVVETAVLFASQSSTLGASPSVLLAQSVLRSMTMTRIKFVGLIVVLTLSLAGGGRWLLGQSSVTAEPRSPEVPVGKTDVHGDPLPTGAVARLGTVRLRHPNQVDHVSISPDGTSLVSVGVGASAILWDLKTGKEIRRFKGQGSLLKPAKFSPDGRTLAVGENLLVRIFEVKSGKEEQQFALPGWASDFAFSPDGKKLRAVCMDSKRSIVSLDVAAGKETSSVPCEVHDGADTYIFSPDAQTLFAGKRDKVIRLIDPTTGKVRLTLDEQPGLIMGLAASADGKTLATSCSGDPENSVRLWDPATGKATGNVPGLWTAGAMAIALSSDGKLLATLAQNGPADKSGVMQVVLRDVASGKVLRQLPLPSNIPTYALLSHLAFSDDAKTLVGWGIESPGILVWDVATGEQRHGYENLRRRFWMLSCSSDGRTIAAASDRDRSVYVWKPQGDKPLRKIDLPHILQGLAMSADGATLAASCQDHPDYQVRLWNLNAESEPRTLPTTKYPARSLSFSAEGKNLVVGEYTKFRVLETESGKELRSIERSPGGPGSISPDGRRGVWSTYDKSSVLVNLETGKDHECQLEESPELMNATFTRDGKTCVASDRQKGMVGVWDVTTGKLRHRIPASPMSSWSLSLSPDGRTLATAASFRDDAIHFWDVATGKERGRISQAQGGIVRMVYTPDGKHLIAAGADSTIVLWDPEAAHAPPPAIFVRRDAAEFQSSWRELLEDAPARTVVALWKWVESGPHALEWLGTKLSPAGVGDAQRVEGWLKDLDDARFEKRQSAQAELEKQGDAIEALLKKALAGQPTPEVKKVVESLLQDMAAKAPQRRREIRLVNALELMDNAESRKLLEKLAAGRADAELTLAAQKALDRLRK